MISFDERIDCDSFILGVDVTLSSDHERHLAGLEIVVDRSVGSHDCIARIGGIVCTILGFDCPIEITFGNSVYVHIRQRKIRCDFYDQFTICEDVSLRQIIHQSQSELEWACFPNW